MPANTKRENPKRTHRLTPVRVTEQELQMLKSRAAQAGLSVSEFQRRALLKGKIIVRSAKADRDVVRHLSEIGSRLLEIKDGAGHAHNNRLASILEDLDQVIMEIIDDP